MLHNQMVVPFTQQTRALCNQLTKAEAWCTEQGIAESALLDTRLADDMFPLSRQLDFVSAQILQPLRRLTGQELADPAEALATIASHRARLEATLDLVAAVTAQEIDSIAGQPVALDLPNGMAFDLTAADYVRDWAVPQFYFHLMAAYSIMRMRGVPLGKADYVPHMMQHIRRTAV